MTRDGLATADEAANRAVVGRARLIAGALVAGVLGLTALSGLFPVASGLGSLVLPAAVLGAVAPVIGYRFYLLQRDRLARVSSEAGRRAGYLRAVVLALAITEGAAVFGVLIHALTGDPLPLIGAFTHVLLAGAIWPGEEKLQLFLEASPREDP